MFGTDLIRWSYRRLAKPAFFKRDPEIVHDAVLSFAETFGKSRIICRLADAIFTYRDPALSQDICGIHFSNPVGNAGGFDKDGRMARFLPHVGFGFIEVGSVTARPCDGNPKPRLWRLPASKSLIVWYGLKNEGCDVVGKRIVDLRRNRALHVPLSINIAKTNDEASCEIGAGIEDYAISFRRLHELADIMNVNVSCPNTGGGEPFLIPENLDRLLTALDAIETKAPIFLKFSADTSIETLHLLIDVALTHRVHGLILSNLSKDHSIEGIAPEERDTWKKGGVSGAPMRGRSDALIAAAYARCKGRLTIIGLGGIFSAEDAYRKIRAGASLVQLVTGLIYEGPQLIGEINRGLVDLLKRDGFESISEAVGADQKA